jgi:outer membrane protein assembly factor BamE (lipoprotein component of BamABCDE complex)
VALARFHAFESATLAPLQDGKTTRQDVLLRLGTPSARFEGDRLLTYDFVRGAGGQWQRVTTVSTSEWMYPYVPGSCSLVLVFRPDGVLERHTLVKDRESAPDR